MGLEQLFGDDAIGNAVAAFQQRVEHAAIFTLQYYSEELAKYAKDNHTYTDRTGNLTNSIAYAIAKGKEIILFGGPDQSGESKEEARKIAEQMADGLPNQYSLIIVAGMNYAAYVEAKGYNVILPAELKAKAEIPALLEKLKQKVLEKAKQMFG